MLMKETIILGVLNVYASSKDCLIYNIIIFTGHTVHYICFATVLYYSLFSEEEAMWGSS